MMAISFMHLISNTQNLLFLSYEHNCQYFNCRRTEKKQNKKIYIKNGKKIKMQPVQVQLRVHCVCPHSVCREQRENSFFFPFFFDLLMVGYFFQYSKSSWKRARHFKEPNDHCAKVVHMWLVGFRNLFVTN